MFGGQMILEKSWGHMVLIFPLILKKYIFLKIHDLWEADP